MKLILICRTAIKQKTALFLAVAVPSPQVKPYLIQVFNYTAFIFEV